MEQKGAAKQTDPDARTVETQWQAQILRRIRGLLNSGRPVMVAIDGRCGSGKTCLANVIREQESCNVFHMDDFYLPMKERLPDWEYVVGGNMDFQRIREQVLEPSVMGKGGEYIVYECGTWRRHRENFGPADLTIVEGSYSMADPLREYYDLRIFLTCSAWVQEHRLRKREGDRYGVFREKWIPMEERYYAACAVMEGCDLVIDTGALPI